jgi:methyl-accepting chemotaxis protein
MSVKLRLTLAMVALLAVSLSALVWVISARTYDEARRTATRSAKLQSEEIASTARRRIDEAMATARDLATSLGAMAGPGADRAVADEQQAALLDAHDDFLGVWSGWEPDAFDGRDQKYVGISPSDDTGRFVSYWNRGSGTIASTPLVDYDQSGAGDFYQVPFGSGQEKVLDPYAYEVDGTEVLMTSAAVPIRGSGGTIVGVAGVDLTLDALKAEIAELRPGGKGAVTLVSTSGAVVASSDSAQREGLPDAVTSLADRARTEGVVSSEIDGDLVVATPVDLDQADVWVLVVQIPTSAVFADASAQRTLSIGLTLVALVIAAAVTFLVVRRVLRPVEALRDRMAEIADGDGDLRQRIEVGREDEIGQLGLAFNRFVDKVADTVRSIKGSAQSLSSAADDLVAASDVLGQGVADTSSRALHASTDVRAVDSGIQELATATNQMSSSIREISLGAGQASTVAQEASREAEETGRQVAQLSDASAQIEVVVELITSIAEQTNLLALNATIEAARAGEAGKGFAVVATEVKQLATQTAAATDDIRERIESIQSLSGDAASAIQRIGEVVARINEHTFTIAGAVEEQGSVTSEMDRTTAATATGSSSVASEIDAVAEAVDRISSGTTSVREAADQLRRLSQTLDETVDTFSV